MSKKMPDRLPPGRDKRGKKCQSRRGCRRKQLQNLRGTPAFAAIPGCSQIFAVMLRPAAPGINWVVPSKDASFLVGHTGDQESENGSLTSSIENPEVST